MKQLNEIEKLRGDPAIDFMWSLHDELHSVDFDELSDVEKKHNRHILKLVENAENVRDFADRVRNMAESYEKIDNEPGNEFKEYVSERLESATTYDPETVEQIHDVKNHSWNDINEALNSRTVLDDREQMYKNRIASWSGQLNPEQLSDTLVEHYMREKRSRPDRAESFETATEKIFAGLGMKEYQEALDEVEMLPQEDSDIYMEELERLVLEAEAETGDSVYGELKNLLSDAEDHLELAAYTETYIEHERNRSPENARELEEKVNELYTQALPTEPLH